MLQIGITIKSRNDLNMTLLTGIFERRAKKWYDIDRIQLIDSILIVFRLFR